jgi:hypothetical protein
MDARAQAGSYARRHPLSCVCAACLTRASCRCGKYPGAREKFRNSNFVSLSPNHQARHVHRGLIPPAAECSGERRVAQQLHTAHACRPM